ncbi:hypothetical protein C8J57DRAFT_1525578 [Mycena rebaudengoi]|nr:hypothetical protein C8J57DRAFT_1525578 [Mycena rebaudengoi]
MELKIHSVILDSLYLARGSTLNLFVFLDPAIACDPNIATHIASLRLLRRYMPIQPPRRHTRVPSVLFVSPPCKRPISRRPSRAPTHLVRLIRCFPTPLAAPYTASQPIRARDTSSAYTQPIFRPTILFALAPPRLGVPPPYPLPLSRPALLRVPMRLRHNSRCRHPTLLPCPHDPIRGPTPPTPLLLLPPAHGSPCPPETQSASVLPTPMPFAVSVAPRI